jgi:glutathione-regulated potassium-efflux system ancillary protein KefC/glutathione-regulated potassium-efflux system protein KefB
MPVLTQAVVLLGGAVIAVVVARRLGLGSILGYLVAGAALGPWGLRAVQDVGEVLHLAELGVVLLLFVIGLELQPTRLWTMRRALFGLGGAQVALTTLALAAAGWALGLGWRAALVAGVALSLSSTAFALQLLAEKKQLTRSHGRAAFAVLLFQDLIAIPVLALLPLLGERGAAGLAADITSGLVWLEVGKIVVALAAVILGGRFLLRPLLRIVARTGIREAFTATALFTVVGTALIADSVGLSMALGAFLAGVLLAESEYRHALEAVIEPFKGILLGLFFVAVGMTVNFGLLASEPATVIVLTLGVVVLKVAVLAAVARLSGHRAETAWKLAAVISQGGEFAFVIFSVAAGAGVIGTALADRLVLVVTLSMATTPLVLTLIERLARRPAEPPVYDLKGIDENQVIIAGFGRYGQIVGRILGARKIGFTALEISPDQVDFVARYGNKVYYGDASDPDVLHAAHADRAVAFVLAIDDVEASVRAAEVVKRDFPHLKVLARARNRQHAYRLMDQGVVLINRETYLSSIDTARRLLEVLGLSSAEARRTVETFRDSDERRLLAQHRSYTDEERLIAETQAWTTELEQIFAQDAAAAREADPTG